MHIVYMQFRYRNNVQAIYILRKQYTYWVRSMAIVAICNMVAAIPPHILQVGLDAINLLLELGSLCNFTSYPFCMRKVLSSFATIITYIKEKKNSKTMTQKKINGIKDSSLQGLLEECGGMAATIIISIIAYCHNSHIVHSICIWLAHYIYCLCIVPVSKLHIHNMHTARNRHSHTD